MHDATVPTCPNQAGEITPFDAIRRTREDGSEFWSARDLMSQLGYVQWRRFEEAIERAKISAQAQEDWLAGAGNPIREASGLHFRDSSIETTSGKGRAQLAADVHLSRFACYLVAMNGDPRKPEIAAAQRYFAIRTRQAERIEASQAGALEYEKDPDRLMGIAELLMQKASLLRQLRQVEAALAQEDLLGGAATLPNNAGSGRPGIPRLSIQSDLVQRIRDQARPRNMVSIGEIVEALGIKRNRGVEMLVSEVLQAEGFRRVKSYMDGSRTWVYRR